MVLTNGKEGVGNNCDICERAGGGVPVPHTRRNYRQISLLVCCVPFNFHPETITFPPPPRPVNNPIETSPLLLYDFTFYKSFYIPPLCIEVLILLIDNSGWLGARDQFHHYIHSRSTI